METIEGLKMQVLLILTVALVAVSVVLQLILLFKRQKGKDNLASELLQEIAKVSERAERSLREEFSKNREEFGAGLRETREEISNTLRGGADSLNQNDKTALDLMTQPWRHYNKQKRVSGERRSGWNWKTIEEHQTMLRL